MKSKNLFAVALMSICFVLAGAITVAAKVPDWAIGTFTARNPQNGGTITLTIQSNGNVTANFDGAVQYGSINDTTMNMGGAISKVTKTRNGIRTTRKDNGEAIDYNKGGYDSGNGNGNGNWNGGNNGGNQAGNVPSWAQGTFYGTNPQNGTPIKLTIQNSGQVQIDLGGGTLVYATMYGDQLNNNGIISRITKTRNGIRTTRNDNGEAIDYSSNYNGSNNGGWNDGNNGNNNGNWNNGGNKGDVPSWARGTFRARNPQTGGNITLYIEENGNVTIDMDGYKSYATMYKDTLNNNGIFSKVTKTRNGIRTTRNDNGEVIDYRK
jgi:hypothetical protein